MVIYFLGCYNVSLLFNNNMLLVYCLKVTKIKCCITLSYLAGIRPLVKLLTNGPILAGNVKSSIFYKVHTAAHTNGGCPQF